MRLSLGPEYAEGDYFLVPLQTCSDAQPTGELGRYPVSQLLQEVVIEDAEHGQVQHLLVEVIVDFPLQMLRILQRDFGVEASVEEPLGLKVIFHSVNISK